MNELQALVIRAQLEMRRTGVLSLDTYFALTDHGFVPESIMDPDDDQKQEIDNDAE